MKKEIKNQTKRCKYKYLLHIRTLWKERKKGFMH